MVTINVVGIIYLLLVLLFGVFVWAMCEVHFIHKTKKCKHTCFLCEYANMCHDGGCAYDDTDSVNINNEN